MSLAYRWYGEKKTHFVAFPEEVAKWEDSSITSVLHELFDEADIVIAHNARKFDNKKTTAAFIRNKMLPPSPYKTIDTLAEFRSKTMFNSNSLDELCRVLGIGRKSSVKHADMWYECMQGDEKAWKLMKKYNINDVDLLVDLYEVIRPYMTTGPNIGDIEQTDGVCPHCGSSHLIKQGTKPVRGGVKQRYQCKDCGGWAVESSLVKEGRLVNGTA